MKKKDKLINKEIPVDNSLTEQSTKGDANSSSSPYQLVTPPTIYTGENRIILEKLLKVTAPTDAQVQQIYTLYKLYVNPKQVFHKANCNSCNHGIANLYWELMDFYVKNKNRFE